MSISHEELDPIESLAVTPVSDDTILGIDMDDIDHIKSTSSDTTVPSDPSTMEKVDTGDNDAPDIFTPVSPREPSITENSPENVRHSTDIHGKSPTRNMVSRFNMVLTTPQLPGHSRASLIKSQFQTLEEKYVQMCDGHMERISNLETMCCDMDGELHKHTDKWLAYMSHYDDTVQILRKELDRQDDIQHKLYSKIADMEERHVSLIHHNHRDIKTLEEKNSLHKEHVHSDHNHIDTPQSSQTSTDKLQYDNVPLLSQDNSQSTQYYLVQGHDDPLSNFYRCTLKVTIDGLSTPQGASLGGT